MRGLAVLASITGRANAIRRATRDSRSRSPTSLTPGQHVTINSPLGGKLAIGQSFRARGRHGHPESGPNVNAKIGDSWGTSLASCMRSSPKTRWARTQPLAKVPYLMGSTSPRQYGGQAGQGDLYQQQV